MTDMHAITDPASERVSPTHSARDRAPARIAHRHVRRWSWCCSGSSWRSWRRSPAAPRSAGAIGTRSPQAGAVAGARTAAIYWLGTDDKGRDILSRLIFGSRLVLFWSTLATVVAYSVGMLMGVAAGYRGGWWDEVLSFIGNIFLVLPADGALHRHPDAIRPEFAIGPDSRRAGFSRPSSRASSSSSRSRFGTAPQVVRIVRGIVLDLKTRDYIAAAEVRGEKPALHHDRRTPAQCARAADRRCLPAHGLCHHRHRRARLPRPRPAAARSRLGQDDRRSARLRSPWRGNAMLWPAVAISSLVLGLNLLADGLREISLRD